MIQTANDVSPAQYWGRKFINSANRQYVILCGYAENSESIADSLVFFTDEKGKMLTTKGLRWSMFWNSYAPSMLKGVIYEVTEVKEISQYSF